MPEFEFAVVGDNCIDRFFPPVDDCLVGGNAVNVAVQFAMLGRRVCYFGAVGDDKAGQAVRFALEQKGVAIDGLRTDPTRPTAYTNIEISADGERDFVFEEFGACAEYRPSSGDVEVLRTIRHVHIGWLDDNGALKLALQGSGGTVSQDLSVNNTPKNLSPDGLDIAFLSSSPENVKCEIRELLAKGVKIAVAMMGVSGSIASDGRQRVTTSAPLITPEDTTGAGDALIAGFLDAYKDGKTIAACLNRGTERAGLACMHRGGFPQPHLKGFREF